MPILTFPVGSEGLAAIFLALSAIATNSLAYSKNSAPFSVRRIFFPILSKRRIFNSLSIFQSDCHYKKPLYNPGWQLSCLSSR